jgi:hypothetical protein
MTLVINIAAERCHSIAEVAGPSECGVSRQLLY